jgi:hypothetical protein
MMGEILLFVIGILISAFCLWAGMKLTRVDGSFSAMLVISIISSLFGFIPFAGWVIASIVMFVLICKWTDANFWPDAVLMVVVARALALFVAFGMAGILASILI